MSISVRPELIPILSRYGSSTADLPVPSEDIQAIATEWIKQFSGALAVGSADAIMSLFIPDVPIWRDFLVLSWDFRTRTGVDEVHGFLKEHLTKDYFVNFVPVDIPASVARLNDEVGWINIFASFDAPKGRGTAVIHLVPTKLREESEIRWLAQGVFMDLDELKGHPPLIGELRKQDPVLGGWEESLSQETKFENNDPTVVIIGGSQSGLAAAARLKALGVSVLVLERHARIGDSWRNRYDALCLHDPVWYDHMPYLPFPPTWPVYTPARKLANWLESYASILELPVWLSSNVSKVYREEGHDGWHVDVDVQGEKKTLNSRHVIFAIGWGSGTPVIPDYPGTDAFAGEFLHSATHKTAKNHVGKKVVVVGSSTSSHDVCADLARHGIDVTMVQRSPTYIMSNTSLLKNIPAYSEHGPPTDVADRISASTSIPLALAMSCALVKANTIADKDLLDGLHQRGFRTYDGPHGTGFYGLLQSRGGGYYFNTGACELIIDGKIKVKSDAPIDHFNNEGLVFTDGSKLSADVVIWACGYGQPGPGIKRLIAPKDSEGFRPVWELDNEGELGCVCRDSGVKGLYVMMGNLAAGRYYSKHLSLRIKAIEEGLMEA